MMNGFRWLIWKLGSGKRHRIRLMHVKVPGGLDTSETLAVHQKAPHRVQKRVSPPRAQQERAS